MRQVIAVDMGGTNIRAARVDETGTILARHTVPTPATAPVAVGLDALMKAIARVRGGMEDAAAIACPGPPGYRDGELASAPAVARVARGPTRTIARSAFAPAHAHHQ